MQLLKHVLPITFSVLVVAQTDTSSTNLTSLFASNQNLTGLATLLNAYPGLAASVANATNITILAPSNNALAALNSSGALAQAAQIEGYVQALLSYHVLQGTFYAENITTTPAFVPTLLNNTAFDNVTGGQVVECRKEGDGVYFFSGLKNNVTVVEANLNYTNGVVHVIDNLLTLPVNTSTTASAADLTALLGAVSAANLSSTLDATPDLTIFAPSNAAFENIGSALSNVSIEDLTSILSYHVVKGTVAYSSTLANGTVPTLGGNVTISVTNGSVFVNSARVINADILLSNGVLHVIDSVLNPNNTATANGTETMPATAFSGASSASLAITSGLPMASTTNAALVSTESAVASGYSTNSGQIGGNPANTATAKSSSSQAAAGTIAMPTGAIGVAALFGGAAVVAGW